MFYLSEINKDDAALACLVSELDAFQRALYPAESHHCLDLSTVSNKKLRCVIVRDANGLPAGCGTLLLQDGNVGEIKRVYIRSEYRGRQLGEQILASLDKFASENSCYELRLETGIHQQPAVALYRRCGYRLCEAFPPYISDPLSVYMCKDL